MELSDLTKAKIPLLEVINNDPIHIREVIQDYVGVPLIEVEAQLPNLAPNRSVGASKQKVLVSTTVKLTTALYKDVERLGASLIYLTTEPSNSAMIYSVGELFPQVKTLRRLLDVSEAVARELRGLTVTQAKTIIAILKSRGEVSPSRVAKLSTELYAPMNGLYLVDPEDLYTYPPELAEWTSLNLPILINDIPALRPRGLMLEGGAGTGKTSFAKKLGAELGWSIFRLDIASSLQKYLGESEQTVRQHLQSVAKLSPCILLIDEVEKIFSGDDGTGSVTRILSYLLWWLAEHQDRVFTVMTSNNLDNVPPELYRAGRIDEVITLHSMSRADTIKFAENWLAENYLTLSMAGVARLRTMVSQDGETPIQAITYAKEAVKWERLKNG